MTPMPLMGLLAKKWQSKVDLAGYDILFAYSVEKTKSKRIKMIKNIPQGMTLRLHRYRIYPAVVFNFVAIRYGKIVEATDPENEDILFVIHYNDGECYIITDGIKFWRDDGHGVLWNNHNYGDLYTPSDDCQTPLTKDDVRDAILEFGETNDR